jgi:hypothetical protein
MITNITVMDIHSMSDDRLRRELKLANEDYTRHLARIPDHAWQYEPYKSILDKLLKLRDELLRRKKIAGS